jgi:hypothetical protein
MILLTWDGALPAVLGATTFLRWQKISFEIDIRTEVNGGAHPRRFFASGPTFEAGSQVLPFYVRTYHVRPYQVRPYQVRAFQVKAFSS